MMRSPLHNENLSFVMNEGFFNAKCFSFFCIRVELLVQRTKGHDTIICILYGWGLWVQQN